MEDAKGRTLSIKLRCEKWTLEEKILAMNLRLFFFKKKKTRNSASAIYENSHLNFRSQLLQGIFDINISTI